MRIAIWGAGGVGGYFGGRLAQAGEEVIFVARGAHLEAIRAKGLTVESVAGDLTVAPAQATDNPDDIGPVEVIIVGVKAWQVPQAAQQMKVVATADTVVLPLQNGVDAPRQLAEALGREHVLGGLCRIISFISAPGTIRHAGIEPYVAFGELDNRHSERVGRLKEIFDRAQGISAEVPDDINLAMWRKFLLIAAWSGVGAATRAPLGVMRSQPETRALLRQAMEEIVSVAQAHGVALSANDVDKTMTFIDGLAAGGTASMQRDIIAGHPSELASQNGAVVRLGEEKGVDTPLHRYIYHSLLPQERRARGEQSFEI